MVEDAEPIWIEHLDTLDDVVVLVGPGGVQAVDRERVAGEPSTWPLDPLTPVAKVAALPAGSADRRRRGERRLAGATLTAALQLGLADRCTELAVAYAKERVQFDRPIGSFQAIKHLLRRHARAHRSCAGGGVRRGRATSTTDSSDADRGIGWSRGAKVDGR